MTCSWLVCNVYLECQQGFIFDHKRVVEHLVQLDDDQEEDREEVPLCYNFLKLAELEKRLKTPSFPLSLPCSFVHVIIIFIIGQLTYIL